MQWKGRKGLHGITPGSLNSLTFHFSPTIPCQIAKIEEHTSPPPPSRSTSPFIPWPQLKRSERTQSYSLPKSPFKVDYSGTALRATTPLKLRARQKPAGSSAVCKPLFLIRDPSFDPISSASHPYHPRLAGPALWGYQPSSDEPLHTTNEAQMTCYCAFAPAQRLSSSASWSGRYGHGGTRSSLAMMNELQQAKELENKKRRKYVHIDKYIRHST